LDVVLKVINAVCLPQTDVNAIVISAIIPSKRATQQQDTGQIDADAPVVKPAEFLQVLDPAVHLASPALPANLLIEQRKPLFYECDESIDQTGSLR